MPDIERPRAACEAPPRTRPPSERLDTPTAPQTFRAAARELFCHPGPRAMAAAIATVLAARIAVGGWSWTDGAVALAVVALWPLYEWLTHLIWLHFRPRKLPWLGWTIDSASARRHRLHHVDPWQTEYVLMDLRGMLGTIAVAAALWLGLAPTYGIGLTGLATMLALGLHYEWTHFLVHTPLGPRSGRFYRALWRHHLLHHFKSEHHYLGVSSAAADALLRTRPDPGAIETSPTVRDLYGEVDGDDVMLLP